MRDMPISGVNLTGVKAVDVLKKNLLLIKGVTQFIGTRHRPRKIPVFDVLNKRNRYSK